jgi:hypothetical protein
VATTVRQAPGACGFSGKNAPDTCPFRKAAFRAATRADPLFAEAWYNLSDLLDERGRLDDCLRSELRAAPDYTGDISPKYPDIARLQLSTFTLENF